MKLQIRELVLICLIANLGPFDLSGQVDLDSCGRLITDQIIINTGIDPITGSTLSGNVDPNWNLILYPPPPIAPILTPGPGVIVTSNTPYSAWFPSSQTIPNNIFNAQYLSINSGASGVNRNKIGNPFRFQRCFCLSESSEITFEMDFIADDYGKLSLKLQDNSEHYFIPFEGDSSFKKLSKIKETLILEKGRHCLNMDVRDLGGVVMGFGVVGKLTGKYLLNPDPNCCPTLSTISGTKFEDINCNGNFDNLIDSPMSGWVINLTNQQGQIVASGITDSNGNYSFINIENGIYTLSEVPKPGWTVSSPKGNSHSIKIDGQNEAGLDFFNCQSEEPCKVCPSSFSPIPGRKYVLSAWVKEDAPLGSITYNGPEIFIKHPYVNVTNGPFKGEGNIIDEWQRIESVITIPSAAKQIEIELNNSGSNEVFFDDIRIHPFSASMKSFVYNPVSLRLMAELDERNYATFYEYDEEGALIRVKKETALGIQTIQQSFNSTRKIKSNQ